MKIIIDDLDLVLEGDNLKINGRKITDDIKIKIDINGIRLKYAINEEDKKKMLEMIHKETLVDKIIKFFKG